MNTLVPDNLHQQMHADHRLYQNETSLWLDDLRGWEQEQHEAAKSIDDVKAIFQKQIESLQTHAAAVRLHDQTLAQHEKALAGYEQGEGGMELPALAKAHTAQTERHAQQRAAHERLRRLHHAIIVQWNLVRKTLGHT